MLTVENVLWSLWTSNRWFPSISFYVWLPDLSLLSLFSHLWNERLDDCQAQVFPTCRDHHRCLTHWSLSLEGAANPPTPESLPSLFRTTAKASFNQKFFISRKKILKVRLRNGLITFMFLLLFHQNKDDFFGHSSLEATSLTGRASRVGKSHWAPKILIFSSFLRHNIHTIWHLLQMGHRGDSWGLKEP